MSGTAFVLAVSGLLAEARVAKRSEGVRAVAGGGSAERLETLIRREIDQGAVAIISFGVAAGLGENTPAGTGLVAREIIHDGATYATDRAWTANLLAVMRLTGSPPHPARTFVGSGHPLPRGERGREQAASPVSPNSMLDGSRARAAHSSPSPLMGEGDRAGAGSAVGEGDLSQDFAGAIVAGVDMPLVTRDQKRTLHEMTGALAADMESHIAARLAAEHGLPFAALRVIADPGAREVPAAALAGMNEDGTLNVAGVVGSLMREPGQLTQLLRLAGDMHQAMRALLRCRKRLGPGLGFPGFDLSRRGLEGLGVGDLD